MKIVHVADTHLGFDRFNGKFSQERKEDIKNSFVSVVSITNKINPDVFIHAGDLFNNSYPSYDIIEFAAEQLNQIKCQKLIISGTHDTPKGRNESHVFSVLRHLVTDSLFCYEHQFYTVYKGYKILLIPFIREPVEIDREYDIIVFHGGVRSLKEYKNSERILIPNKFTEKALVLLGDYHKSIKTKEGFLYAGSTENFSFGEEGNDVGLWEIDTDGRKMRHNITVRGMVTKLVDLHQTTREELYKELISDRRLKRLILSGWEGQDLNMFNDVPFLQIELAQKENKELPNRLSEISNKLEDEWEEYCKLGVEEEIKIKGGRYLKNE